MDIEHINRKELDQFSANILINLALINTAALAAVVSVNSFSNFSPYPYALGLISSILSQLLWYSDSAFSYTFGNAVDERNQKLGTWVGIAIISLGTISAGCIVYGCLRLLNAPIILGIFLALLLCGIPLTLLILAAVRETKTRALNQKEST